MTYLLFIRRLDDLHTAAENRARRTGQPIDQPGLPARPGRPPLVPPQGPGARCHAQDGGGAGVPLPARTGRGRVHLLRAHEGRPVHHPDAGAAVPGGRHARRHPDAGPGHHGRPVRVRPRQDRDGRHQRPVPDPASHHQAHGRDDRAPAHRRDLRPGLRNLWLPRGCGGVPARAPPGDADRRQAVAALQPQHVPRLRLRLHDAPHRQHEHAPPRGGAARHPLPRLPLGRRRRRGGARIR